MKKLLAILCTVALLLGTVFTGMVVSAEETTELTKILPGDLDATGTESLNEVVGTFLNCSFEAEVTTSTLWYSHFGFASAGWGRRTIHFSHAYPDSMYLCKNSDTSNKLWTQTVPGVELAKATDDAPAGTTTATFLIKVDIVAIDSDADGAQDDVQLTFYINGTQVGDPAVLVDEKDTFATYKYLYLKNIKLANPPVEEEEEPSTPEIEIPELAVIGTDNFTNTDQGENKVGNQITMNTGFANTSFQAFVRVNSSAAFRFCAGTTGWSGYGYTIVDNKITVNWNNAGSIADYTTEDHIVNTWYKLRSDLVVLDSDADGSEDDIALYLYIDDKLMVDGCVIVDAAVGDGKFNYANYTTGNIVASGISFYSLDWKGTAGEIDALDGVEVLRDTELGLKNKTYGKYTGLANWGNSGAGSYTGDIYNKIFETDILFENGGYLRYPMIQTEGGIQLKANGENLDIVNWALDSSLAETYGTIATITPDMVNGTALVGNSVNLKIYIERLDLDEESIYDEETGENIIFPVENDVRITYYINNVAVKTLTSEGKSEITETVDAETGEVTYAIASTTGGTALYDKATRVMAVNVTTNKAGYDIPTLKVTRTPADWGATYQKFTATTGPVAWQFNVDTIFNTDMIIHSDTAVGHALHMNNLGAINLTDDGRLYYVDFVGQGNARYLTNYDIRDKRFNLKIAVQTANVDGGEVANDIRLAIYIDGVLADGNYIYIKDFIRTVNGYATFFPGVEILAPEAAYFTTATHADYTFKNFKWSDGERALVTGGDTTTTYFNFGGTNAATMVNTVTSGYITIKDMDESAKDADRIDLYFGQNDTGLRLGFLKNGSIYMHHGNAVFTETATIKNAFTPGEEFLLQIAVEKANVDLNNDGTLNDLRFAVLVNGKLVGGRYWYFNSAWASKNDTFSANTSLKLYAYAASLPATFVVRSVNLDDSYSDKKMIGVAGIGADSGTYVANYPIVLANKTSTDGTMQNKVLKAYVNFEKGGSYNTIQFGKAGDASFGFFINSSGVASATNYIGATPSYGSGFTLPDFKLGETQEWMLTQEWVNGALKLGVWIDGVLQNGQYIYLSGINGKSYIKNVNIYSNVTGNKIYFSDYAEGECKVVASDLDNETYTFTPVDGVTYTVNGEAVTEAMDFDAIGEYVVTETKNSVSTSTVTTESVVVVYVANDLTGDGDVNVLDFIAMTKNAAGDDFADRVAVAAAGKENLTDTCTPADLIALKKVLLGIA